jgi:hypothetical protein
MSFGIGSMFDSLGKATYLLATGKNWDGSPTPLDWLKFIAKAAEHFRNDEADEALKLLSDAPGLTSIIEIYRHDDSGYCMNKQTARRKFMSSDDDDNLNKAKACEKYLKDLNQSLAATRHITNDPLDSY